MTGLSFFALVGVGLFSLGLYALIVYAHLLRKILAINVMGSGVFLVLVALGSRFEGASSDSVPHAMVITGIVVAVAATAFALSLMRAVNAASGRSRLADGE